MCSFDDESTIASMTPRRYRDGMTRDQAASGTAFRKIPARGKVTSSPPESRPQVPLWHPSTRRPKSGEFELPGNVTSRPSRDRHSSDDVSATRNRSTHSSQSRHTAHPTGPAGGQGSQGHPRSYPSKGTHHPQGATPERRVVLLAQERRGQTGLGDSHPLQEPVGLRHPLPCSTCSTTVVEPGRR